MILRALDFCLIFLVLVACTPLPCRKVHGFQTNDNSCGRHVALVSFLQTSGNLLNFYKISKRSIDRFVILRYIKMLEILAEVFSLHVFRSHRFVPAESHSLKLF